MSQLTADVHLTASGLRCERDMRVLFTDLDVSVEAGECVELLGPNGSGKSTLLRTLAGLFPDYTGIIDAAPLTYLGHANGLCELLTPRQNLEWFAEISGTGRNGNDQIDAILDQLGLYGFEDTPCQQLSQGQKRRTALARLLLLPHRLWLLDEPLNALDDDGQRTVADLIRTHCNAGGSVLCATHQSLDGLAGRSIHLGGN
jgi:heme exporter protein A